MIRSVCLHNLRDVPEPSGNFSVLARTCTRADLLTATQAAGIGVVVLDLESEDALAEINAIRELSDSVGIVAVTYGQDAERTIAARRAGCNEIVVRPISPSDLGIALDRAARRTRADESERQRPFRTFALIGATGGTGTTTIACHLAIELASMAERRVALVDFDLEFGGIARCFDISPTFTLGELAGTAPLDESCLTKIAVEVPAGVDLYSRPATMPEAAAVGSGRARQFIQIASRAYPFTVIDLARRMDGMTRAAAGDCDRVLVVLQPTVSNVDNARRIMYSLMARGVAEERMSLVVNRYSEDAGALAIEVIERELGRSVLGVVPSDYASVNEAMDDGRALTRASPVRAAIRRVAQVLTGHPADSSLSPRVGRQARRWFGGFAFGKPGS